MPMTFEDELKKCLFEEKCCWYCGGTSFLDGPSGGMCQNIACASCGARYNVSPFTAELIGLPTKAPGCLIVGRREREETLVNTIGQWIRKIREKESSKDAIREEG